MFTWTTQLVVDRVLSFSKALSNLRHRFPFRKWQVGEGMFCGSEYVQNKDNKEINKDIMITQTEFAVKITKVPMSPARKKMRDDFADKAETHALRGVSGSICGRGEGVQGVLTLFCSGAAQVCHDDRVVELKEQLEVEEEDGDRQEEEVEEKGVSRRVLSSVTIAANFASTSCRSGLWFEFGGASRSSAC